MKVGIIDLGTNSARLFVYKQNQAGHFMRVLKSKSMVRLGDELFETGELSEEAIERTVDALLDFDAVLRKYEPDLLRAIATSAMREAGNPERILDPVLKHTGIALEVISGAEEARLIAVGVLANLNLPKEPTVLIDIGGGSTEISLVDKENILFSESLPLGAGRNQQTFLCSVPPVRGVKGKGMQALRDHVKATLELRVPEELHLPAPLAIGTSGSIRAFRRIAGRAGIDGTSFNIEFLNEVVDSLKGKDRDEILKTFPTLEPRRADLILAAGIILQEICKFFRTETIRVTSCSLKDGVLANLQARYHL